MQKHTSQVGSSAAYYTTIGIVKDTNDPAQMGRVRVYCPSIDHEDHSIDNLPWAIYVAPFGGAIKNMVSGPEEDISYGQTSYGFWAVPKHGATVLVQFINGDTNYRVWTGCMYPVMDQRGLPAGRGFDITQPKPYPAGPYSDSYEDIEPARRNLEEAGLHDKHYLTRGGYERQISQAVTDKDGTEGYAKNPAKSDPKELDPQGYCMVTPGRHYISMQDSPDFCRVRIKTTTGHQILMDDTNERIYISTNKGKTWFEMDTDGHIHFYGEKSVSFSTGADFNVTAKGNINMKADGSINMTAGETIQCTAVTNINLNTGCSTLITATDTIEFGAGLNIVQSGAQIHLNTMSATQAPKASAPGIVPIHEPFDRPKSDALRNKHWAP